MIGSPTIRKTTRSEIISKCTHEQKKGFIENAAQLQDKIDAKADWLTPFLCQYDERFSEVNIIDGYFYNYIKWLIKNKHLYIGFFEIAEWAYPDSAYEENEKNLQDATGWQIEESYPADGYTIINNFIITELIFDDAIPYDKKRLKKINLKKQPAYIEYGTTSIDKTANYLMQNVTLIRIPYEYKFFEKPYGAVLHNSLTTPALDTRK